MAASGTGEGAETGGGIILSDSGEGAGGEAMDLTGGEVGVTGSGVGGSVN